MSHDLNEAKRRLLDKLGPNYNVYIQLLGKWFRGMISKEEFDQNAKQLIKQNFVLEHNKFWLAFFHHCANSATSSSLQSHGNWHADDGQHQNINSSNSNNTSNNTNNSNHRHMNDHSGLNNNRNHHQAQHDQEPIGDSLNANCLSSTKAKVRCLPSRVITHMKIFVIAWEMGLDSASDNVSSYITLALRHFLKNIITELICTKTAYRLRENRFKHAIGIKPMNPYLNNSLRIYNSYFDFDPYQIASNRMNSSLVDHYAYNDSLFPQRLHETQALHEYACSTTSVTLPAPRKRRVEPVNLNERRLTLYHLLITFLSDRTIIPSQSLYSINLERIFTRLSN